MGLVAGERGKAVEVEAVGMGGGDGAERGDLGAATGRRRGAWHRRRRRVLPDRRRGRPRRSGSRSRRRWRSRPAGRPRRARGRRSRASCGGAARSPRCGHRLEPPVAAGEPGQSLGDVGFAFDDAHRGSPLRRPLLKQGPAPGSTRNAADAARFPLRAEPERGAASRPRLLGAHRPRALPAGRRPVPGPHRGHRPDPLPPGIRGGDFSRPRLARARMGGAGAAAVGAFRRLCGGARQARGDGPGLSRVPVAGRDRGDDAGTGLAARPRRRAALPRRRPRPRPGRGGTAHRERRALCAPPAHRRGGGEGRAIVVARGGRRAGRRDRHDFRRPDGVGRLHPRPKRDADQLPPLGGGRRRGAGRDPCRPRPRPLPRYCGACAPAAAPRAADAGLSPSRSRSPTRPGENCPSPTATPASVRSARPARPRTTSGGSSGSTRRWRRSRD